jgi:pimeloyl-ACP methyl ester carboxylesterase
VTGFVLIPGAGGAAWYWSYVVERLHAAGHDATAVDLPADDETAGLDDYTEITLSTIGGRPDVVVVAQSLGGFTAA